MTVSELLEASRCYNIIIIDGHSYKSINDVDAMYLGLIVDYFYYDIVEMQDIDMGFAINITTMPKEYYADLYGADLFWCLLVR